MNTKQQIEELERDTLRGVPYPEYLLGAAAAVMRRSQFMDISAVYDYWQDTGQQMLPRACCSPKSPLSQGVGSDITEYGRADGHPDEWSVVLLLVWLNLLRHARGLRNRLRTRQLWRAWEKWWSAGICTRLRWYDKTNITLSPDLRQARRDAWMRWFESGLPRDDAIVTDADRRRPPSS